jgi:outer membrane protein insertion porin family
VSIIDKRLLLLFLTTLLFSQNDEIRILDIVVEGNQRLSEQDIQRNARLYKGMNIKGAEIQQAIKRLWNLNRFGNIQILVDEETEEGIYLRIIIEEYPSLGEVEFEGNKRRIFLNNNS